MDCIWADDPRSIVRPRPLMESYLELVGMRVALLHGWVGGLGAGGGGSRHMLDVALRLQARGHEVTVATYDYDPGAGLDGAAQALEIRSVRRGGFHGSTGKRTALR